MTTEPELSNVLDNEIIADLMNLRYPGGPDIFAELVEMFVRELPVRLSALRASLDHKDPEILMREAHRLKGSCHQMGATRLAAMCYAVEQAGRGNLLVDASKLDEIDQEAARVSRALLAAKKE
jgi:HPt (histidine-containing phosphotransfer) domain-containing protein